MLLNVNDLSISYRTRQGVLPAVRQVSFQVRRGEILGLVGESGCGKSTLAFGMVNFLGSNGMITGGSVWFEKEELVGIPRRELNRLRGNRMSLVYQDPMAALNPCLRIEPQLTEVLTYHRKIPYKQAREQSLTMLQRVYLTDADEVMRRYPHQLSGGQQQRVVIAMAMLNHPALLIMDEPTSALDVTVEAVVLDLVEDLRREFHTGIIFITHNLPVVSRISDQLGVMYAGEIVEKGPTDSVMKNPAHPYTQELMHYAERLGSLKAPGWSDAVKEHVPQPGGTWDTACVFAPRCTLANQECFTTRPKPVTVNQDHTARCLRTRETQRFLSPPPPTERKFPPEERQPQNRISPVLMVEHLKIYYEHESRFLAKLWRGKRSLVRAVDDVSCLLPKGKTLSIVGESGCGKSTLLKGIIGLEEVSGGKMEYLGLDITKGVKERRLEVIRNIQMVFQNPDATLNPAHRLGSQIARPLRRFNMVPSDQVRNQVVRLLEAVRLGDSYYNRYPRELSGGEKQRAAIARALASLPEVLLCDEPISALDVSTQATLLTLFMELQKLQGIAFLFITHDLRVARSISDYVAVMYLGQIMEMGPVDLIYTPPYHPYTEALLSAMPTLKNGARQKQIRLSGDLPSPLQPPSGCPFHTRCPRRQILPDDGRICEEEIPPWRLTTRNHHILCHIAVEKLSQLIATLHPA